MPHARWTLATKLAATGVVFLLLALGSISLTLWVTWQLEGGAAAVNEAGRMRMLSYRIALQAQQCEPRQCAKEVEALDAILERLHVGDPSRPLFVPWNQATRDDFRAVRERWQTMRGPLSAGRLANREVDLEHVTSFVALVDHFVSDIERQLSEWTTILRGFQFTMVALAIASAVALLYAGYLLVLNPLSRLQQGIQGIRDGQFGTRVPIEFEDEFGDLAAGFNQMAEHLQALYGQLEEKVREKTAGLEAKRERLAALYDVASFIGQADTLDVLAQGFAERMRRITGADAVAVRWSAESNERYLLLASEGLPEAMSESEQCLTTGSCHCGQAQEGASTRVIPIYPTADSGFEHCAKAGYRTLVSVPVTLHHRLLGEIDLFFLDAEAPGTEERSLYEALAAHLAGAMEGLRAVAMQKEAAVAGERSLIAQELHDSIAQSLAFLKIQVQLLRDAIKRADQQAVERTIGELDVGVRESYNDVRELLLHFRTRTNTEDIEPALRTTLQKFEHQTGLRTQLQINGHGLPLPADMQVQVLHVVQEALSNVRKHARASEVVLRVQQSPEWRFEVSDNGEGFDPGHMPDETHVGLRIMRERAQRIGAQVAVQSQAGGGTTVVLTLPGLASTVEPAPLPAEAEGSVSV